VDHGSDELPRLCPTPGANTSNTDHLLTMLFIGVAVLLTTVVIVLLAGHYLLKIPYDDLVGVASGVTGNPAILVYSAWASGKVSTREMLRNWVIVYFGNLVGSLGLVVLVFFSHHLDMNGGRIGLSILNTAVGKIQPDVVTLFFKGILCNLLVCLAVWLAYAGRSVTDKIVALILPISTFIAAGFEHCVANMYFLPLAWLLTQTGHVPADFDASLITISGIVHNLVPVTLGNIVGGAGLVGAVYWAIYRAAFDATYLGEK
jgi:formate/nitrite transporter